MLYKFILTFFLFVFLLRINAQANDFNTINFKKADSIAKVYRGETLHNLPQLSYNLTYSLKTEAEQFRAIYKWVCENIANDYNLYKKNDYKRQRFKNNSVKFKAWNNEFRRQLFHKLLKKKRTICTGYAYLVRELSRLADIECEIVQGFGRVSTTDLDKLDIPNHSWNAVKLNNKWYLCDPTWASGIPNPKSNRFEFKYNDGFFLARPELFAINHFPVDSKWWLLDKDIPTFEAFLASPVLYGNAYKNLNTIITSKVIHHDIKKGDSISFEFELKNIVRKEAIKLLIDSGNNAWERKPTSVTSVNNKFTIKQRFVKTGFYDVHIYIGDDLITTYTVKVKKT